MTGATASSERTLVSVVIPTHNRRQLLRRVLDALAEQSFDAARLEVIVVADGCTDDTALMLSQYVPPYRLLVLTQPAGGAAEARNAAAAAAAGPILIFLDDDVEPTRGFVDAHLAAHASAPGTVVLGAYPPAPHASPSLFRLLVRQFWTAHFDALADPGHRFTYRDVLTGNLSVPAQLWRDFGGLDPRFRKSREDYEFGVRLLDAGVPLVFAPEALAWHHENETASLGSSFRRAFEEGRMDALMAQKHPAIMPGLLLAQPRQPKRRLIDRAIFALKHRADPFANGVGRLLPAIDRAGLRGKYVRLFWNMRMYWYVRGVSEHFGSLANWERSTRLPPPSQDEEGVTLDLRQGLAVAAACLDELRPRCATLHFGPHKVGTLRFEAGAEPWRGAHLAPYILRHLRLEFLKALALEGEIITGCPGQRETLARCIEHATRIRDRSNPLDVWQEQREQWARIPHAPEP